MKTINLKTGRFVYELGVQKMYESKDEILKDYPHYDGAIWFFHVDKIIIHGYVRNDDFTNEEPRFVVVTNDDVFEILN